MNKRSLAVRHAQNDDLTALAFLFDGYRQFYDQSSDIVRARSFLSERLSNQDSVIFIAEDVHGTAAGFAQLYPSFTSIGTGKTLVLNDLFVLAEYRRLGVAGELLRAIADFATRHGVRSLTLSTAHDNISAQGLYERHGWRRDQHFVTYELGLEVI